MRCDSPFPPDDPELEWTGPAVELEAAAEMVGRSVSWIRSQRRLLLTRPCRAPSGRQGVPHDMVEFASQRDHDAKARKSARRRDLRRGAPCLRLVWVNPNF